MSILVKSVRVAAMMGMLGLVGSAQTGFAQDTRMLDVKRSSSTCSS